MRALLAIAAATAAVLAIPVSPAAADDRDKGFTGRPTAPVDPFFGSGDFRRNDRRRRDRGGDIFLGDWEYTGNQIWRPESFNDWWHERPNRSYPAWVLRNRDCQRMWWDGAVLRC